MSRILKVKPGISISNSKRIVDTRNRILHGYDSVSDDVLWLIAIKYLPIHASGNIKIGQKALIDLENYPSNQYGLLTGEVSVISNLPNDDTNKITIKSPQKFITTYGKEILKKQNIKASVLRQTKEYSLLERIFQNILYVTENRN